MSGPADAAPNFGSRRITGLLVMALTAWISASSHFWPAFALALLAITTAITPSLHRRADAAGLRLDLGDGLELHKKTRQLALIFGIAAIVMFIVAVGNTPEARARTQEREKQRRLEEGQERLRERAEQAAKLEELRKGFHCLNNIDGSHWDMQGAIKDRLRNPDSFDHVETAITPEDTNGHHQIIMTYRAQNGFGGMNVERAIGEIDGGSCKLIQLSI